jgi:Ankyrin repeats (3 copies)
MSINFNCCNAVTRYVPNTGANDVINRITNKTTPEEFEQIRKEFPQFQLGHSFKTWGSTVLHKAAGIGNVQLIKFLVKQAPELLERGRTTSELTPLYDSYKAESLDAMETLLELGANPNIMVSVNGVNKSWLQAIANLLLSDLTWQEHFHMDHSASIHKHSRAIKLLLKYGAESRPEDDQENDMNLPGIKSLIQKASQEVAEERRQEQSLVRETIYYSKLIPTSDLCALVSEYI